MFLNSKYEIIEPCGCTSMFFLNFKYYNINNEEYIECVNCGAVWLEKEDSEWIKFNPIDAD